MPVSTLELRIQFWSGLWGNGDRAVGTGLLPQGEGDGLPSWGLQARAESPLALATQVQGSSAQVAPAHNGLLTSYFRPKNDTD